MSPEFDELTDTIATAAAAPIRPWWLGEEETTGDEMSPEVPKVSPHVDVDELTDMIATAYAAVVPIPLWWPAAERADLLTQYAGYDACMLLTELDNIVDDVTDWAAFHQLSNDDRSQMIAIQQEVLLDAALELKWDLSADIADRSAALIYEGVFDHHRPRRVIWPPTRRQL